MSAFETGPDFKAARLGWLYSSFTAQPALASLVLAVGVFAVYAFLQFAFGLGAFVLLYGHGQPVMDVLSNLNDDATLRAEFSKASIAGMLPAALCGILLCLLASRLMSRGGEWGLPFHLPRLGLWGWVAVLVGFVVTLYLVNVLVFTVLGIDPTTYQPTSLGVNDDQSQAGVVEKALADMADEPWLFAFALPSVVLFVPLLEEMLFRGALFSSLVQTRLGRAGTVVSTSAMWAVCHAFGAPWLFIGIIFCMGLLLGLLLLRFGSLWVTVACHGLWNGLTALSLLAMQSMP